MDIAMKLIRKPRPHAVRAASPALGARQTEAGGGLTPMLWLERWGNMTNRLTPRRLAAILQAADDGEITEQHVLFADMEDRCEHLAAEIGKRKRALLTLDWEIMPGRANDARADAVACAVREQFDMLPVVADLLLDMADGIGHGFAALEIEWGRRGELHIPTAFHHRPQSWFQVLRENRNELRLRDGTEQGAELWPLGWVVHTHRSKSGWLPRVGLFRTVAWAYLIRAYALESAIMYTQVHGMPFRLGKYPPGSTKEDLSALRAALANLGRDASGIIPMGMEIMFETPANATQDVPGLLVTRCEQGMSKAILGGTLTSQADGKTSTNALGEVHNEVRHDLLLSDAEQIAATISRQILAPLALLNCGEADPAYLPWFRFDTRKREDIAAFADALPKLATVMRIPSQWAHEKLKIPMPEKGEAVLGAPGERPAPEDVPPVPTTALKSGEKPPRAAASMLSPSVGRRSLPTAAAGQQSVDALLASDVLTGQGAELLAPLLEPLLEEVARGMEPAELLTRLGDLYPRLDTARLEEMMARALLLAAVVGEDEARGEEKA